MTASLWLWVASFAVGLAVVGYSLSQFDAVHRRLVDTVRARQPGIDSELLGRAVDMTLYLSLGAIAVLALVQLLLAVLMFLPGANAWFARRPA